MIRPGGCASDGDRDCVVSIDPKTKTIVGRCGVDDMSGTAAGPPNTPGGFDLPAPDGTTPIQPWTG